jgi:hypothetical protein
MNTFSNTSPSRSQTLANHADLIALAVIALVLGTRVGTPVLRFFSTLGLMPQ